MTDLTTEDELIESIAWTARESGRMAGVPAKPVKKQQYTYRCPPQLYDAALEKAQSRGEDLPEIIRQALRRYVEEG